MARLTIELFRQPDGGQPTFRISLVSDEDATPREHERDHRRAVVGLLGVDPEADHPPRFRVERERPALEAPPPCSGDDGGYEVIDLG